MSITLGQADTILFTGDSITDSSRREPIGVPLGIGYVRMVAQDLSVDNPELTVINTGINGNRAVDLQDRWKFDVLDHRPNLLSIMIGINDTWRRYDANNPTSAQAFETSYRDVLTRARDKCAPRLVILEPFLVPVAASQRSWRSDLDPKIDAVRRLADEFDATLVPTDAVMNDAAQRIGATAVVSDGVHPTETGHRILADAWLDRVAA